MKNLNFLLFSILLVTLSCSEKEDEVAVPLEAVEVKNLSADASFDALTGQPTAPTGKFTLYSLKENAIVANTDSTTTKWDIGFRGTTIIVNGGAIRTGQGGAYIYNGLFNELMSIPETQTFSTDQSASQLAIATGSGNGWFNYDPQNNWISPIPGRVIVLRTGDGNYTKLEILSYYKDLPTAPSPTALSRHYSFRYIYQSDGTRRF